MSTAILDLGNGRALLTPMVLAKLVQAAQLRAAITCSMSAAAPGYSSAVLARLAGSVVALEEDPDLARRQSHARWTDSSPARVASCKGRWLPDGPLQRPTMSSCLMARPRSFPRPSAASSSRAGGSPAFSAAHRRPRPRLFRQTEGHLVGRPVFDAAEPCSAGLCRAAGIRFLAGSPAAIACRCRAAVTRRLPVAHMCH